MTKLVIIVIASFCVFIALLILFTRKEEANEKKLKESGNHTKGYIERVERIGKSISKGEMILTYAAQYSYTIDKAKYSSKVVYEVKSDVLDVFPEIVDVYYDSKKPKNSLVYVELDQSKIKTKETVKSLFPCIVISIAFCILLIHLFVAPLL